MKKIETKNFKTALESVERVRKLLRKKGFLLDEGKHPAANGTDIEAWKNGSFNVEVKTAQLARECWRVGSVSKQSKQCDAIAIVFPEEIIFQPMQDHLKLCSSDGSRHITKLQKLTELLVVETNELRNP